MFLKALKTSLLMAVSFYSLSAAAAKPVKMVIISAPQALPVGACSAPVKVQAQDSNSLAAAVPTDTRLYFTGSSSTLKFFKDSSCLTSVSSVLMPAGNTQKAFYFKGSVSGSANIVVATYNYIDASQTETIGSSTTSTTTTTLPQTTTTTTLLSTTTTTLVSGTGIRGRAVPAPIYGVTLDDIANVSGIISSLNAIVRFPTSRIVFDAVNGPTYYKSAIQQIRPSSYVMGQILDSTDMAKTSVSAYQTRTQNYVNSLGNLVDIWEIGNEINGNWLGSDTKATGDKVRVGYDVVHNAGGATALTFFWEGNPSDPNNCVDGPGYDMFGWINNFLANPENDRVRLGLDYVFVSWYPQQCNNIKPDWTTIFNKLAQIFPNAKVGFGEIGTADPQYGSTYEINLINEFYPLGNRISLPPTYVGGYFWWYFYEEMIPTTKTPLMNYMNNAILSGPQ